MTPGEVFKMFRQMPNKRELVEACYLDEDLLKAAHRFYESDEFQSALCLHSIRPDSRVLDLGGGCGTASLAWYWAGHRVVLVEPDPDPIVGTGALKPIVAQNDFNIEIAGAFSESLPFSNQSFDVFYARQVLHHVTSLEQTCSEAYRVLKPGGALIITREHVISQPADVEIFRQNHPVHPYTGGENAHLLNSYRNAIKQAGFRRLRTLGPWEHVINYYPTPYEEIKKRVYPLYRKALGEKLARSIVGWSPMFALGGRYLGWRDHTPGRLYSFAAIR
jgi:ubiquinone/menaquinone biosynthesis C-methylase UbiE